MARDHFYKCSLGGWSPGSAYLESASEDDLGDRRAEDDFGYRRVEFRHETDTQRDARIAAEVEEARRIEAARRRAAAAWSRIRGDVHPTADTFVAP